MLDLDRFVANHVTYRPQSMFAKDIENNLERLVEEIRGQKVCVIGGAGSIWIKKCNPNFVYVVTQR